MWSTLVRDGALREVHGSDGVAWSVFRDDAGAVPVFWAWRGQAMLPSPGVLRSMTVDAVEGLFADAGLAESSRRSMENLATALCLAATEILGWEGMEWPVDPLAESLVWAGLDAPRVPFDWLRVHTVDGLVMIDTQQDDALFGLNFLRPPESRELPFALQGDLLPRRDLAITGGVIVRVGAVFDTTTPDLEPGILTECLLQGNESSVLLIAADDDGEDDWYPFGESVAVLTDPVAADVLGWLPPRTVWRFSPSMG